MTLIHEECGEGGGTSRQLKVCPGNEGWFRKVVEEEGMKCGEELQKHVQTSWGGERASARMEGGVDQRG